MEVPHVEGPRVRWGLGDVLIGIGLVFAVPVALSALVSMGGVDPAEPPPWFAMGALLGGWVGLGVWPLLVARYKGKGVRREFGFALGGRDVAVGAGAGVAVLIGIYAVELGFADEPVRRPSVELLLPEAFGVGHLALVGVALVVVTPVVEELFFRGLVLRAGERRWGTPFGVGLSTVLFALLHLEPGVSAALRLLIEIGLLGLVLALLAVRTGRLGPSIAAHAMVNAVGVSVAFAVN